MQTFCDRHNSGFQPFSRRFLAGIKISDAYEPPEKQNKDCLLVTRPKTTINQRRGQGTEFI